MTRRRRPEQDAQRGVVQHLQLRAAPGTYWFHPANGGARTAIEGAILKGCGVRSGTPDLILIHSGRTYGLELKSLNGRLTPAQAAAHQELRAAGAEVAVAVGLDAAIKQLENWNLLRGATTPSPIPAQPEPRRAFPAIQASNGEMKR